MKFVHFEGTDSVNLEFVREISISETQINFNFDSVAPARNDSFLTLNITTVWMFNTKEEAEKVYNQILKEFSTEIKIEE